jgi:hypothetical protein
MHRYRVLGVIISVVLTIALSLGFASAAGYLPGPAAGKAPSAAAVPGWAAAPSGDEVAALAALKGKAKGLLLQARGDDDDAGRPEGAGRPEEKGPPPGQVAKQSRLGVENVDDSACSVHPTGMTEDGLAERDRYQLRCRGLHAVLLVPDAGAACEFCPPDNIADPAGYVAALEAEGRVEQFNFYGPLAHLNQLRSGADADDIDDERGAGRPEWAGPKAARPGATAPVSGPATFLQGNKWSVAGQTVLVTPEVPGSDKMVAGANVTVKGVRAGNQIKATSIE